MNPTNLLQTILDGEHIRPVYQPIVSLRDGTVWGYEALSRPTLPACCVSMETLFAEANRCHKLWELEKLCRTQALKGAHAKPAGIRLFLNVDPNILYDPAFIAGFTQEKLAKLHLNPDDIIFEITEKSAVSSLPVFTKAVAHYQQQGFQIAIDDFGSGYSGLARACAFSPNYLKMDRSIIRGIDKDCRKRSILLGMVRYCQDAGVKIIAEGVETREELATLLDLHVDFGQGYLFAPPGESFCGLPNDRQLLVRQLRQKVLPAPLSPCGFDTVGTICQRKPPVFPWEQALTIYERMKSDPSLTEFCVVDDEGYIHGILTRSYLLGRFSGQFGYDLCYRRTAGELARRDYMAVDCNATVDEVAALAMDRGFDSVYDAVCVTEQGRYLGMVTVRDLLMAAIRIREQNAADANPLSGLPGNNAIQRAITAILQENEPYAVAYLDLDNFKAYNDAYGFARGDCMLQALAQAMRTSCSCKDFLGHVGGDDFVVITHDLVRLPQMCEQIVQAFSVLIQPLYSPCDWERGFIVSKDRSGQEKTFPVASLSIAAVIGRPGDFAEPDVLSRAIANVKHQCKQQTGNAIMIVEHGG